ncbi:MAG: cytosine deaminase [Pseudomonadales bacterium]|jgi:cytosine/creatinine deaminase|uniref:cytosine deaminase n=1 Tax=Halopseudomonas TaxID=2901189 RepID=UPI000C3E4789|nr:MULTISPECIES: cytosine deaminase [Halopseudomonas]MAH01575.1 cytosine deaminase [Pseudomonadales bacterium]MAK73235.1 cytosine deaminase [Pseudomonadales bacterium]MAS66613.1 cytosine deaminase [Pseudomonadales bacterium]MAY07965.1 cytosine deaminase [Pseudomonadales bacterium]MBP77030.1 cytosine deaminase [Pseudomonadales bacterium]|tara:strand:+ start:12435 stop:13691 length:1257 start_codon:yes stop_codon:yes gene_type:complete
MTQTLSAIVNARLPGETGLYRVEISAGRFSRIEPQSADVVAAADELDAGGNLLLPPFVEPHIHLDAALTAGQPRWNQSGTLFEGIECWGERKAMLSRDDVISRAEQTLKLFAAHGIQYVRTHVDVTDPQLTALRAMVEVRDRVRDFVDLQIVAFPQEGILSFPGGKELMSDAVTVGADVIGGIPHFEFTRDYGVESVKLLMDLAEANDCLVDVHCDEIDDPQSRFLEVLAAEALSRDYGSRVTASHTCAMHSYEDAYCSRLFRLLGKSGLRFVALPTENLHLQGRFDGYPKRRGITRVPELLDAGLKVCFGQDSIRDPWYPMGNGNLLRTLDVGLHACHMLGMERIETALEIVTDNGAAALNLAEYGIAVGNPARCMVLNGTTPYEVLLNQSPVLASVRDGRCLVQRAAPVHEVAGWS